MATSRCPRWVFALSLSLFACGSEQAAGIAPRPDAGNPDSPGNLPDAGPVATGDAAGADGGAAASCGGGDGQHVEDMVYKTVPGVPAHLLSLDIYTPVRTPPCQPAPVVVWVHGGGWRTGDKTGGNLAAKVALFRSLGYVLVSLNYRLSPMMPGQAGVKHPVHSQDVASAVAWVHANIANYGGDPQRLALLGHSAGAHLVALVSTDESYLSQNGLQLQNLRCTGSLDTEGYDIPTTLENGGPMLQQLYSNAFGDDPAVWRAASPSTHVAAGKGIPDFLLASRGSAERRAGVQAFANRLMAAGVNVQVIDAAAYEHEDVNRKIGDPDDAIMTPAIRSFLNVCFTQN